jgi:hypothetical protein
MKARKAEPCSTLMTASKVDGKLTWIPPKVPYNQLGAHKRCAFFNASNNAIAFNFDAYEC